MRLGTLALVTLAACGGSSDDGNKKFLDAYVEVAGEVHAVAEARAAMPQPLTPDQETAHALVIATAVNGFHLPPASGAFAECREVAEPALATLEKALVPLLGSVVGGAPDDKLIAKWTEQRDVAHDAICELARSWLRCGEAAKTAKLARPELDEPFPCPK